MIWKIIITAALIFVAFLIVAMYACVIAASDADRREEEQIKDWKWEE